MRNVADDGRIRLVKFVDLRRVRIDVQDLVVGFRIPFRRRVLDEVVADGNDEVSVLDQCIGIIFLRDADGAAFVVVIARDDALRHHRVDDGDVQRVGKMRQRLARVAADGTMSREHDGALGSGNEVGRRADARDVSELGIRLVGMNRMGARPFLDLHARDVARQIDMGRARFLLLRVLEGIADDFVDRISADNLAAALRHRLEQRHEVEILVRRDVHALRADLARDADERRAIHIRIGDARDEVCRARAERAEADACTPCQAAVHVGHERRALLVAHRDELDGRIAERLDDFEILFARDAEDVLDAFAFQAFDEDLRGIHKHRPFSFHSSGIGFVPFSQQHKVL